MKLILLFSLAIPSAFSAQKQLEIKTLIYRNTAGEVFPVFNFGIGTMATLKIIYDDQIQPIFTGKMIINQDGGPQFNAEGEISYDSTVSPSSPTSNESRYTITGQIILEIDGRVWSGNSYNVLVYNNMPTIKTFDEFFIECDLIAPNEMQNMQTQFKIHIRSNGANSIIHSTMLPLSTEYFTNLNAASTYFSLRPISGTRWVINSNILSNINITPLNN